MYSKVSQSFNQNTEAIEKLRTEGAEALYNSELMELILGDEFHGSDRDRIIRETITVIKRSQGEISYLQDLLTIEGMNTQKAAIIISCLQLARRFFFPRRRTIGSPDEVYKFFLQQYSERHEENFICIMLNAAQEVIRMREISRGIINRAVIHPREVFIDAIIDRANGIIVAHNHPSGNVLPSDEDFAITKRLMQASRIIGIALLDHIIFAKDDFFSFRENGKMDSLL